MEELKNLPLGAVWDQFCVSQGMPAGLDWINASNRYENEVLLKR